MWHFSPTANMPQTWHVTTATLDAAAHTALADAAWLCLCAGARWTSSVKTSSVKTSGVMTSGVMRSGLMTSCVWVSCVCVQVVWRHKWCDDKWTSCVWTSATPATQSDDPCHQVPRLPRKTPRRPSAPSDPSAPPEPTQRHKCHACHAKWRSMSSSATPATQSDDPCHQVRRLPHKIKVDVTKCHACHAKRRGVPAPPGTQARHQSQPSAISATPATQSDACHTKWRSMSQSATAATQNAVASQRPLGPKRATRANPVP